ncbi:hypothetical protein CHU92_07265 [Flavobacterium cyanobacteriorum]|uniref:DUF3078 domain-containing protein n=1 Tax=Flavobacterium cyanobacteriorum TaxID=2022802 RepID=A0A255Z8W3_9FLAO|nr:DUF3078 domain-containing protein [Flavobacterium cyanobacteriorum]OYQ37908.1 hypothetical protein CHU92_07265 [Flavobacterium cyanobacteriorum]
MKIRVCLILLLSFIIPKSFSQVAINTSVPNYITHWEKTNTVGLDITQVAFVNWNVGGNNSVSGLAKGNFMRKYVKGNINWHNELILRYGLNSQEGQEVRKTDDQILLNSTFGYRKDTLSNWYYSAKFSFTTQFANGYAYPNTTDEISGPFSPAYIFLGIGTEYMRKDLGLTAYFSPLTDKTTLVLNRTLADQGAFGVERAEYDAEGRKIKSGRNIRTEVGILVTNNIKRQVFKNIMLDHRLSLYTDYLNKFGNIDVNWQLSLDMTVNEYVKANIGTHIIYDDDIKATEERDGGIVTVGPKIQLKQILGVGLTYSF